MGVVEEEVKLTLIVQEYKLMHIFWREMWRSGGDDSTMHVHTHLMYTHILYTHTYITYTYT